MTTPQRYASVDALRGLTVAAMLLVNTPGDWDHVYAPLEHAAWNGCTPTDVIFPMFVFVMGVSIALSIEPRIEGGVARATLRRAVGLRAARIVAIGLALHLVAWWAFDRPHFRPLGVLPRIGLCYAAAGIVVLDLPPRARWPLIACLLLGYWCLLAFGGGYAPWTNLASRVDTALLGPLNYRYDIASGRGHDPEGLLSTLPAIATALLGVAAGGWLRAGAVARLAWTGAGLLLLAGAWAQVMPINKNLWTSSYAAWTAGWSMLLLAAAHVAIDRKRWPALGASLGVNAIAVYAGSALMVCALAVLDPSATLYRLGFAAWIAPMAGPKAASLAYALAFTALWWGIAIAMRRRGWHIRV